MAACIRRRRELRAALPLLAALWAHAGHLGACSAAQAPAVAVAGAGIGGSATAYFLRQELGNDTRIDVFERDAVGGRTQAKRLPEKTVEIGASIVHESNQHFRQLADAMGLARVEPGLGSREARLAIWDGKAFVFAQSRWSLLTAARMLWRYGLAYFRFKHAPAALLAKFKGIYGLQARGEAFETPEAMLRALGLLGMTRHSLRSELQALLGTGAAAARFGREFVGGINHINYNQDNRLNAFAGMVSMLPTVDGRLFAIEGGNFQLAERLLDASGAVLHRPVSITAVERAANGSFLLHTAGSSHGPYAAVVLATPLETSGGLRLEGLQPPPAIPPRAFQQTVTSVVRGRLRPSYFGVERLPGEYVMVAEDAGAPFSVIAPLTPAAPNGTRLYKTFSDAPLPPKLVAALFEDGQTVVSHTWRAYPRFSPPERFAPFVLAPGLVYGNALENAASAMEVAAIAAKNSALLTARFLAGEGACAGSLGPRSGVAATF